MGNALTALARRGIYYARFGQAGLWSPHLVLPADLHAKSSRNEALH